MKPATALHYANLAALAYKDDKIVLPGYEWQFISRKGSQVHILTSKSEQLVIFRGTEPREIADLKADLNFMKNTSSSGGHMHGGFKAAYQLLENHIYNIIDIEKPCKFIGHSLGGALAIIAGVLFPGEKEVITFGSPRVYDAYAARNLKESDYINRFENAYDPVPFAPPALLNFRHLGTALYMTEDALLVQPSYFRKLYDQIFCRFSTKLKAHSIQTYIKKLKDFQ